MRGMSSEIGSLEGGFEESGIDDGEGRSIEGAYDR